MSDDSKGKQAGKTKPGGERDKDSQEQAAKTVNPSSPGETGTTPGTNAK